MIIVVALKSEATPFVNELKLRRWPSGGTNPLYLSEQHQVLVTGVGGENAHSALNRFISDHPETIKERWLNVGIAGAYEQPLGQLVWIEAVRGQGQLADAINTHPVQLPSAISEGLTAQSVAWPQHLSIGDETVYDMELFSLVNCLNAYGIKLICAKVISDNKRAGIANITPQYVTDLIRKRVPEILQLLPLEDKTEDKSAY